MSQADDNKGKKNSLITNIIWSARLKATKPRIDVIYVLLAEEHPISIGTLRKKLPKLTLGTIYRILESFVSGNIVYRMNTNVGHVLYELIYGKNHHHHIICTNCGDIEEIRSRAKCLAFSMTELLIVDSKKFSIVSGHSLEFFGLCKKCA